jgi:hypothetical protein
MSEPGHRFESSKGAEMFEFLFITALVYLYLERRTRKKREGRRMRGLDAELKTLIETGKMKIRSAGLVSELKTFVAHGVGYAAKPGETDDLVMSSLLVVRMLMLLQTYHAELDTQMKDHGDNVIEPMPFISMLR